MSNSTVISIHTPQGAFAVQLCMKNIETDLGNFSLVNIDANILIGSVNDPVTLMKYAIDEGYKNTLSYLSTTCHNPQDSIRMKMKGGPIISKRYLLADDFAEISSNCVNELNITYFNNHQTLLCIELQFLIYHQHSIIISPANKTQLQQQSELQHETSPTVKIIQPESESKNLTINATSTNQSSVIEIPTNIISHDPKESNTSTVDLEEGEEEQDGGKQSYWEREFLKETAEFEKSHAKIIYKSMFINQTANNGVIMMSESQLNTSYKNVYCGNTKVKFIDKWLNYKQMRSYNDIGVYPRQELCPVNTFNLWSPFAMERIDKYEERPYALQKLLCHIRILCNNDEITYQYFTKWIAQMIQYPETKTIVPALISKQGAGKGTLILLLTKILGNSKILETSAPSRDVWGEFNKMMATAFLVNLNELSKRELVNSEGKFKALITDPTLNINAKCVDQYPIISYHRFIITTNNHDSIQTSKDDRRNFIIRCSDEKIGDKMYFQELNAHMEDINVIKTVYEHFKSKEQYPNLHNFLSIPTPKTEFHVKLQEQLIPAPEAWLRDFTLAHIDVTMIELSAQDTFTQFHNWKEENNIEYETSIIKFGVALKNLKIDGIEKGRRTMTGNTKYFMIEKLKKYFNIV